MDFENWQKMTVKNILKKSLFYQIIVPIWRNLIFSMRTHHRLQWENASKKFSHLFFQKGAEVKLVPWNWDIANEEFDGLFVSNGPGDPALAQELVDNMAAVRQKIWIWEFRTEGNYRPVRRQDRVVISASISAKFNAEIRVAWKKIRSIKFCDAEYSQGLY